MIAYQPLLTKRINVSMHQIKIIDARRILSMTSSLFESETTAFLEAVIDPINEDSDTHINNPRLWTVEERSLAIAHYHMNAGDDPDFTVASQNGIQSKLSNYLQDKDFGVDEFIIPSKINDKKYKIIPLLGAMAESIEILNGSIDGLLGYSHWLMSCVAAQLVDIADSDIPDVLSSEYPDWIKARIEELDNLSEDELHELVDAYMLYKSELFHLFSTGLSDEGVVVLPVEVEHAPTRFPALPCIDERTKRIFKQV